MSKPTPTQEQATSLLTTPSTPVSPSPSPFAYQPITLTSAMMLHIRKTRAERPRHYLRRSGISDLSGVLGNESPVSSTQANNHERRRVDLRSIAAILNQAMVLVEEDDEDDESSWLASQ